MPDPFRARPKPDVDTEGLSSQAAELAEKAVPGGKPDNTGGTPDSTPGNHVPAESEQAEPEKPAEKPTHTAEQPRRRKGKRS